MLVKIQKLHVLNEGYKTSIAFDTVFINSKHIISIRDYSGAPELISEIKSNDESLPFGCCLIKINNITGPEEIIALGTSEDLFAKINNTSGPRILND